MRSPSKYYVSIHGGEGWEAIVDEDKIGDEIDAILSHWPRVPEHVLLEQIFIFPMSSRFELVPLIKEGAKSTNFPPNF